MASKARYFMDDNEDGLALVYVLWSYIAAHPLKRDMIYMPSGCPVLPQTEITLTFGATWRRGNR